MLFIYVFIATVAERCGRSVINFIVTAAFVHRKPVWSSFINCNISMARHTTLTRITEINRPVIFYWIGQGCERRFLRGQHVVLRLCSNRHTIVKNLRTCPDVLCDSQYYIPRKRGLLWNKKKPYKVQNNIYTCNNVRNMCEPIVVYDKTTHRVGEIIVIITISRSI